MGHWYVQRLLVAGHRPWTFSRGLSDRSGRLASRLLVPRPTGCILVHAIVHHSRDGAQQARPAPGFDGRRTASDMDRIAGRTADIKRVARMELAVSPEFDTAHACRLCHVHCLRAEGLRANSRPQALSRHRPHDIDCDWAPALSCELRSTAARAILFRVIAPSHRWNSDDFAIWHSCGVGTCTEALAAVWKSNHRLRWRDCC